MIIGDLTTDFEDAEFPELWPTFGFNPNATGPTGNTAYGLCRGPQINGTLTNMTPDTAWVRSEGRHALAYSAASSTFVRASHKDYVGAANAISVVTWVVDTLGEDASLSRRLYDDFAGGPTTNWIHLLYHDRAGFAPSLIFAVRVGLGGPSVSSATALVPNRLYCVCGIYCSGDQRLYLNGTLLASATYTYTLPSASVGTDIGDGWTGYILDTLIYNRALTHNEVATLAFIGPGGWARRKSPTWYIPSGQAFIDHTSNILRLMSGGVL